MTNKVYNLTDFEKEMLIHYFLHHMPMSQRYDLMEDLPKIYHKLTGVKPKFWTETIIEKENDNA